MEDEYRLMVLGIVLAFLLAIGVVSCNYEQEVVTPRIMAAQGLCWGPLDAVNVSTYGYRKCTEQK